MRELVSVKPVMSNFQTLRANSRAVFCRQQEGKVRRKRYTALTHAPDTLTNGFEKQQTVLLKAERGCKLGRPDGVMESCLCRRPNARVRVGIFASFVWRQEGGRGVPAAEMTTTTATW